MNITEFDDYHEFIRVLDVLPAAIGLAEIETRKIVYINSAFSRLTGYLSEELVGKPQTVLHPAFSENPSVEDASTVKDPFLAHIDSLQTRSAQATIPHQLILKNGQIIDVEITTNWLQVDHKKLMVGFFTPVLERVKALENLSKREKELDAIFQNSTVGIMFLKEYRILHRANQRLADILGFESPNEMLGISMRNLHLSEKKFEDFGKKYYETLRFHENLQIEYQLRRKDGSAVWITISGKAIDASVPADLNKGVIWVLDDISERKKLENQVKKERNLFRGGPTVVFNWSLAEGWPVCRVSENIKDVMGYSVDEVIGTDFRFLDIIHPDDVSRVENEIEEFLWNRQEAFEQSYRLKNAAGDYRTYYDYSRIDYDENGSPLYIYGYLLDISDELERKELLVSLLNSISEGILGIDQFGKVSFVNPSALNMLGYKEKELIGKEGCILSLSSEAEESTDSMTVCHMLSPLTTGECQYVDNGLLKRKDGSSFPAEYRTTPIFQDQEISGIVVSFHDVSAHREHVQTIIRLVSQDSLTGLPNRESFNQTLRACLEDLKKTKNKVALIMVDMDHFKDVNDTLGHNFGDSLLIEFSQRLKSKLRDSDFLARLGGDEFAIISQVKDFEDVTIIARKLLDAAERPFSMNGHIIKTNISIGVTHTDNYMDSDKLISQADIALFSAKSKGRGQFSLYQTGMADQVREEINLLSQLSHAIERGEFSLAFQPQVEVVSNRIVGMEALIRWRPGGKLPINLTGPDTFIPLAETRGMIQTITDWTVQRLIEQSESIQKAGYKGQFSLNISAELLADVSTLGLTLAPLIDASHQACFDIEITETAFAKLEPEMVEYLNHLSEKSISLSIDDFGTGYSSLSMLRTLHSNYVKIDKEFISEVDSNEDDYAIVAATISMAHKLGKKVVAEGVETQAQLDCLKKLECDVIQGYFFAKPMYIDDLISFLQKF